jgi:predicted secreted acid phosphatase
VKLPLRSAVVAVAAALTLGLPTAATASAEPAAPGQVSAQALPSYETWIADVTAVANQAGQYLRTRLPDSAARPAIVLDIDNTALQSTYRPALETPATGPVLDVARQAAASGAAIFFVTARPEILRWATENNLKNVGYPVAGLSMRPWFDFDSDDKLKTAARTAIERQGYTIVANIGNNDTDLVGGHAERTFKLPDYDKQLP